MFFCLLFLCVSVTNVKAAETSSSESASQTYVKVTSAQTDYSGTYLIVYETGSVAFNGSLSKIDIVENIKSVTINNEEIKGNYKDCTFEITAMTEGYSIKSASGQYIGTSSDKNSLVTSTSALLNTISIESDGSATIKSSSGAFLRYNKTSNQNRFRYYKSGSYTNQEAIALYKMLETYEGFSDCEVKGSLNLTYNPAENGSNLEFTNVSMRLGIASLSSLTYEAMSAENSSLEFGVYFTKGTTINPTSSKVKSVICTPVKVGDNYQFAVVIEGIPSDQLGTKVSALAYVKIGTKVYFSESAKVCSVQDIASDYISNYSTDAAIIPHLEALEKLCK